ncbi:hypothetical protein J8273_6976 [Carpediemonas membranifera]|uniref:Uncharacterized protein n=1 Tax=Carpediemonas membranifera TaxID=201153 RepID=A0A8J6ARW4_9EUKA|nr:hypothetical protein J8273_6976 [Carpediemonas membranifera]|eukprot:KAG9390725.1 hypothetical protein J8273_6976 [Carpediemonas membranifera]
MHIVIQTFIGTVYDNTGPPRTAERMNYILAHTYLSLVGIGGNTQDRGRQRREFRELILEMANQGLFADMEVDPRFFADPHDSRPFLRAVRSHRGVAPTFDVFVRDHARIAVTHERLRRQHEVSTEETDNYKQIFGACFYPDVHQVGL